MELSSTSQESFNLWRSSVYVSRGKPPNQSTLPFLLDLGVQKGDRVSVLFYNCHQYLEIFFALSKTGAILVPLNWRLAGPELEFIIKDSGTRMIIFDSEFEEVIDSIHSHLNLSNRDFIIVGPHCPDWAKDYEEGLLGYPIREPQFQFSAGDEDPHILMYTSGTTGAKMSRRGLLRGVHADRESHRILSNCTKRWRIG